MRASFPAIAATLDALRASLPPLHGPLLSIGLWVLLLRASMILDDRTLVSGFIAVDAIRTGELLERLMALLKQSSIVDGQRCECTTISSVR